MYDLWFCEWGWCDLALSSMRSVNEGPCSHKRCPRTQNLMVDLAAMVHVWSQRKQLVRAILNKFEWQDFWREIRVEGARDTQHKLVTHIMSPVAARRDDATKCHHTMPHNKHRNTLLTHSSLSTVKRRYVVNPPQIDSATKQTHQAKAAFAMCSWLHY